MERVAKAPFWVLSKPAERTATRTGPPPRKSAPVFIHDAIMPWQGTTLLYAQMRREAEDQDE
ncbi:hypothetical protein ACFORG_01710 [Lutimaribacter marinistellae]|uniref:Uncharacterized protein n=1 Tax=Lutimaribacter marinistellae TaxID=1820329 RepID=A0ABV7TCS4_9RHOB